MEDCAALLHYVLSLYISVAVFLVRFTDGGCTQCELAGVEAMLVQDGTSAFQAETMALDWAVNIVQANFG